LEAIRVVLRYVDGAVRKGYTPDFHPDSTTFHFHDKDPEAPATELGFDGLKALFLVRSFDGNPYYTERKEFVEGDKTYGDKVEVRFGDGETMQASSLGYHPQRLGLFLLPPDPKSNNVLVYAVLPAVEHFRYL